MDEWFSKRLIKWYGKNARDLPWRSTNDPYKIWLSEIILQQTQVAQGMSYYHKFISNYPTVKHLAKAPEDKVLKDWQGLGYYSRARNLHHTAAILVKEYQGRFPSDYESIRGLKGIGDYTAAAIASFAFGLPYAVLDGNVFRLLSRLFGISTPIDSSTGKKQFQELAAHLLDKRQPAIHNQAMMEFGSQYCRPVNPDCGQCIFNDKCRAFADQQVKSLPVKSKKLKISERFFYYLVLINKENKILVNKRSAKDIWEGLYEFVLLENKTPLKQKEVLEMLAEKAGASDKYHLQYTSLVYKHILSHQVLYASFYVMKFETMKLPFKGTLVTKKQFEKLALPRLIEKFTKDCKLNELF